MFEKHATNGRTGFVALALMVLLVSALLLVGSISPQAKAVAAAPVAPSSYFVCTPVSVATFTNRVHVRCSAEAPPGGIYWFGVSTSNSASASRFLSIFTTAKVTGKNVAIWYDVSDTSGNAWGCGSSDCRTATGAEVLQ